MQHVRSAADVNLTVGDSDRRRNGTARLHQGLEDLGRFEVGRVGHPVGHNGRLQGDDGLPISKGLRNRCVDVDERVGHGFWVYQTVALSMDCQMRSFNC